MGFAKCFTADEVWPAELLAKAPQLKGKTLFEVLFRNGQVDQFPSSDLAAGYANDEAAAFGFYLQKGLFEEYAAFGRGHGHDLAPFDTYHEARGLRWPLLVAFGFMGLAMLFVETLRPAVVEGVESPWVVWELIGTAALAVVVLGSCLLGFAMLRTNPLGVGGRVLLGVLPAVALILVLAAVAPARRAAALGDSFEYRGGFEHQHRVLLVEGS